MFLRFSTIPIWPSKEKVEEHMPADFKEKYPSIRVIIDCIQGKVYILVNIYAPNKDKVSGKFYKNLHRALQTEDLDCEENIIIGGDFNCPLDPKLDKKGGVMVPRKMVIDNIECLQNELDLVDVWRIKNPQSRSYTWSQKSPPILSFRLLADIKQLTGFCKYHRYHSSYKN